MLAAEGRPAPTIASASPASASAGKGSGVLASAVSSKAVRFVGIADVNLPRAEEIARSTAAWRARLSQMLDRKDVDAIITATPEHWRALICIHACQAGKDVYAEKPLSLTIREGRLMVDAARKYQRVFQVGSQQRSMAVNRRGLRIHSRGQARQDPAR